MAQREGVLGIAPGEADPSQYPADTVSDLRFGKARDTRSECDLFPHRVGDELVLRVLEDVTDGGGCPTRRGARDVDAIHGNGPPGRSQHAGGV